MWKTWYTASKFEFELCLVTGTLPSNVVLVGINGIFMYLYRYRTYEVASNKLLGFINYAMYISQSTCC